MIRSLWDLFFFGNGLEPIAAQGSGGALLPPVQTLVATLIFAKGKNANRVLLPAPKKNEAMIQFIASFLFVLVYWTVNVISFCCRGDINA